MRFPSLRSFLWRNGESFFAFHVEGMALSGGMLAPVLLGIDMRREEKYLPQAGIGIVPFVIQGLDCCIRMVGIVGVHGCHIQQRYEKRLDVFHSATNEEVLEESTVETADNVWTDVCILSMTMNRWKQKGYL